MMYGMTPPKPSFERALIASLIVTSPVLIMALLGVAQAFQVVQWGPISRNLRLSISSLNGHEAGSPTFVTVLLENLGPDLTTFPPCVEWSWYGFEIRDPNGNLLERRPGGMMTCSWSPSSWKIASHEILESKFDLREKYDFTMSGYYQITATSNIYLPAVAATPEASAKPGSPPWKFPLYATLESNTINIEVQANTSTPSPGTK